MSIAQKIGDAFVKISLKGAEDVDKQIKDMKKRATGGGSGIGGRGLFDALMFGTSAGAGLVAAKTALEALKEAALILPRMFGSITQEVTRAYHSMSDVQKMSERVGVSFTWMSKMRLLAADSNMSMNELEQSLAAFQRNLETYRQNVGEAKDTLDAMGFSPKFFKDLKFVDKQLEALIERLGGVDQAFRRGASMRSAGEQARKFLPLATGNIELYNVLMEQADFIGLDVPEEAGQRADMIRDQFVKLNLQIDAIYERISLLLAPAFDYVLSLSIAFAKTMTDAAYAVGRAGGNTSSLSDVFSTLGNLTISVIGMIGEKLAYVAASMLNVIALFETQVAGLILSLGLVAQAISKVSGIQIKSSGLVNLAAEMRELADYQKRTAMGLYAQSELFSSRLMENYQQWLSLLEREREQREKDSPELERIATSLDNIFKGDALQRNASTMQRLYEKSNSLLKSIDRGIGRVADTMSSAPVLGVIE